LNYWNIIHRQSRTWNEICVPLCRQACSIGLCRETSLFVRAAVINVFCAASDCADVLFQFQNTPEALHRIPRELLGYKLDEEVMLYLLSVIEYIAADILKWTGNYVKNIRKCDPTIGLQNLKIALSADTSLMELTEMLYNEEETSTAGILNDNVEDIVQEMSYDEVISKLHFSDFFCAFICYTYTYYVLSCMHQKRCKFR
uniref:E3 ubiquitin-protein ligase n=1 Tax=Brugia timori TaxID=42155 RepID=A0A0R3R290_9BILA